MTSVRHEHRHLDVVCQLGQAEAAARTTEWQTLREVVLESKAIPGGIRLWLPVDALRVAQDLARREAECCGFLDIELVGEGERLRLDITSAAPDAAPVIAAITDPP